MSGTVPRTGAQVLFALASLALAFLLLSISAIAQQEVEPLRELRLERINGFREIPFGGRILITSGPVLAAASVAQNYKTVLAVRGGAAPYRFTLTAGKLPPGVSLSSGTGTISGTPTAGGTYRFLVRVSDLPRHDMGAKWLTIDSAAAPPAPVTVSVTPAKATVSLGKTQQFTAVVSHATNTSVSWHASVGWISPTGLYTAPQNSSGVTATITATSVAKPSVVGTASVAVTAPAPPPITVAVTPNGVTVASGKTQQFSALVRNTGNTSVTWKASRGSISSTGLYTAPQVSSSTTATITATSVAAPIISAAATVTVNPPAANSLTIASSSVPAGTTGSAYGFALGASGGTTPYAWTLTSGTLPSGISLGPNGMISGSTAQSGQFSFVAQVTDASSPMQRATQSLTLTISGAQATGTMDGPAQLPRVFLQTLLVNTPAGGHVWSVNTSSAFQQALNSAACGDTIQLQAGSVFNGQFVIPAKPCDNQHWIILRTSAPDSALPPEGVRLTPCYGGVSSLPARPALNCSSTQNVLPKISYSGQGNGPLQFASGANHYRLLGLEITRTPGIGPVGELVSAIGATDSVVLDRVWVHGTALDETRRGLALNSMTNVAAVDSYFNDFHCTAVTGTCSDSQAISGGTSSIPTGPFKIVNNFLEAAGENIIFGGGAATLTPADIEIRRNHFFKPITWMQGAPGFIGTAFIVKNHLEFKNAQRVLVEGNIFENSWGGFSQAGFSILLTPKNQAEGTSNICPICEVTDITIRYNTISHVGGGFQIANALSDLGGLPRDGQRYSIHDVIVDDIDSTKYNGHGVFALVSSIPSPILQNVTINHVTAFPDRVLFNVGGPTNPKMPNFLFTNSIVNAGIYSVWSTGEGGSANCAYYDVPLTTVTACFSPYAFSNNMIVASPTAFPPSKWPAGNTFVSSATNLQFANFNGGSGGNYELLSSSPLKNAASDGKDIGADVNAIMTAIAGVR